MTDDDRDSQIRQMMADRGKTKNKTDDDNDAEDKDENKEEDNNEDDIQEANGEGSEEDGDEGEGSKFKDDIREHVMTQIKDGTITDIPL